MIIIVMGVSGCGKTSVAKELADQLQCNFHDADNFHSESNKQKMSEGIALTDNDRIPWLNAINAQILHDLMESPQIHSVYACSALKYSYRQILTKGAESDIGSPEKVAFIHLLVTYGTCTDRLSTRRGHFFKPTLLRNQFDTLEPLKDSEAQLYHCVTLESDGVHVQTMVTKIKYILHLHNAS